MFNPLLSYENQTGGGGGGPQQIEIEVQGGGEEGEIVHIGDIKVWNVIERRISEDSKVEIRHTHRGDKVGVRSSGFNLIQIGLGLGTMSQSQMLATGSVCLQFTKYSETSRDFCR